MTDASPEPLIRIEGIGKTYSDSPHVVEAIRDMSFDLREGDFLTVFGPNGAGKSTLLGIIAGLEETTRGRIAHRMPRLRVGYVFQNYDESLLPWRTVEENIRLPFESGSLPAAHAAEKAAAVIDLLKLGAYRDKYPYMLSGGKKQLTALGRALVIEPDLLIMDEPFSSLDFDTTKEMETLVMEVWEKLRVTTLFVSHNIDEAILLAERVMVLSGRPSVINDLIDVPLPRPRTQETLVSPAFIEIKKQVIQSYARG